MRLTRIILMLSALVVLSLSVDAQNPARRRVSKDTTKKKSEVVIKEEDKRNRGEDDKKEKPANLQKEFDELLARADKARSFDEKKELLLKARSICYEQLKNKCKEVIDDRLGDAYSAEIHRLLGIAGHSNRYSEKMSLLDQARALSDAYFASSEDRRKVKAAYQKEYQQFLDKASVRSSDIDRRLGYIRSALKFCREYGHMLETRDCNASVATYAQDLFNYALDRKEYNDALEICRELPGLGNCQNVVYQTQYDDLVESAFASSDLEFQRRQLEQARDICTRYLQNTCARNIGFQLRKVYTLELDRLLQKAQNAHDLRDKLKYFAEAEGLCGETYSPDNCQDRINGARNSAFNYSFNQLLHEISRSNDYEEQKEMLKEAERLMAKGQLPEHRWEEIRKLKHQVHYNRLEYLLYQNSGSFERRLDLLEQAIAINQNYLQQEYTYKIQERRSSLIAAEINSILRYTETSFSEQMKKLDYATQLARQLERRQHYQLMQQIDRRRTNTVLNEYDRLLSAAREERYLDEKMEKFDRALRFCSLYSSETTSRGGCDQLARERREVITGLYRNMLDDVEEKVRMEDFDQARSILSKAEGVYKRYGQDLSNEMPISSAYQRLYNQYIQTAKNYSARGAYEKARSLLQQAQQLEGRQYWVVAASNPLESQLEEIDRQELDQKMRQLDQWGKGSAASFTQMDLLNQTIGLFKERRASFNAQQAGRLQSLMSSLLRSELQMSLQDIRSGRFASARSKLLEVQNALNSATDELVADILRSETTRTFDQYYSVQLNTIERSVKDGDELEQAVARLDQLDRQLKQDQFVQNNWRQQIIQIHQLIFERYAGDIIKRLSRNNFDTESQELQMDDYYRSHNDIFTPQQYESARSGIAFVRHLQRARSLSRQQQYKKSVDEYQQSLAVVDFAPAAYRRAGLKESLEGERNKAFEEAVRRQISQLRRTSGQNDRISGYRRLQQFLNQYDLPLSAYILEDVKNMKESIFGELCLERSERFYYQMERGDDALNQNNYTAALGFYQEALTLARDFPECGIDIALIKIKIDNYEAAGIFQKRKMALDRLQDRVYSGSNEQHFEAYQEAYLSLSTFYLDSIINKGFNLNLPPYQKKVKQIRNNDFWSYVTWTHSTQRTELAFTKDLLGQLIQDRSFPLFKLEQLAEKMATENYKTFGGRKWKDTFEYFEIEELKREKRFKKFRKAYKKRFKKLS